MKRILSLLTVFVLLFGACACAGGDQQTNDPISGGIFTPAPSSAQSPAPTQETSAATGAATASPTMPAPTLTPDDTPTPVAGSDGLAYSEYSEGLMIQGPGTCTDLDVVIPSHIDGKPVTAIDGDAFRELAITSVVIPYTVQFIDEDAFIDCKSLSSAVISEGLQHIGDSVFRGCDALKKIELPASLQSIASYAFRCCKGLEEVVIHGCYMIGGNAFEDCTSLKKLKIEVKDYSCQIGSNAFTGCTALESVELGEGVTEIGSWCFSACAGIKSLILPKSLKTVLACAFNNAKVGQVYYAGTEDEWKNVTVKNSNEALSSAPIKYSSNGPGPVKYSEGLRFEPNEDGQSYKVSGFGDCTDEDPVFPPR